MLTESKERKKRVVIVTGAGKGLGKAWAIHLAAQGAQLVVNNRGNPEQAGGSYADRVVAEIRAAGGEAVANYTSVEAPDAADSLITSAIDNFGHIDCIIANAGIDRASSFHKLSQIDFDDVMQINFMAPVRLLHKAWPQLREQGYGRVVIVTSTAGTYGNHGQSAYAASKGALDALMKTLAIEAGDRDIKINSVAPYALTQMTRRAFPEKHAEQFEPAATANLVDWLLSPACNVSGRTFIAGAGFARLLQTAETASVNATGDPTDAVQQLLAAPVTTPPPSSASAEFADFVAAATAGSEYCTDSP